MRSAPPRNAGQPLVAVGRERSRRFRASSPAAGRARARASSTARRSDGGAPRRDPGPEPAEGEGEAEPRARAAAPSVERWRRRRSRSARAARPGTEGRAGPPRRSGKAMARAPEGRGRARPEGPARHRVVEDGADEVEADPGERQGEDRSGRRRSRATQRSGAPGEAEGIALHGGSGEGGRTAGLRRGGP